MQIMLIIIALFLILWGGVVFGGKRFKEFLKAYPTFSARLIDTDPPVEYQYADVQDVNLKKLRDTYNLYAIASNGSETEKMINVMNWVHQLSSHAVNPTIPKELNALALIELCKAEKKKLNCWMYSIILNEAYLSLGYPARIIHLKPYWGETKESHFVTAVYSSDLDKWIMMDADMCGYLKDENGELLGISEIRQRLIQGKPLLVNNDIGGFSKVLGKWSYLWYLSKNIFHYACQQSSQFGQESQSDNRVYIELLPDGFRKELLSQPEITADGTKIVYINDEKSFWQVPKRKGVQVT